MPHNEPKRIIQQRVTLSEHDRVPGMPSTLTIDLGKYDFNKTQGKDDDVNPLPDHVVKVVHDAAERRLMALGSFYKYLQIPEDGVKDIESELRKAKHYELLTQARSSRRSELDALRDLVRFSEQRQAEEAQKLLIETQLIRPKALKALAREMDHIRLEEQARLEEDRKMILVRERNVLLDRRRVFEQSNAANASAAAGHSSNVSTAGGQGGPPVLVMNVALGNGKEEKIVVRRHDDPSGVAIQFVKRHNLPDHTVAALANQIRSNLAHHMHATSGRAAASGGTPTRRATRSPAPTSAGRR